MGIGDTCLHLCLNNVIVLSNTEEMNNAFKCIIMTQTLVGEFQDTAQNWYIVPNLVNILPKLTFWPTFFFFTGGRIIWANPNDSRKVCTKAHMLALRSTS